MVVLLEKVVGDHYVQKRSKLKRINNN